MKRPEQMSLFGVKTSQPTTDGSPMQWTHAEGCYINGVLVQAPLVYSGPYTISCRYECFPLSFRPEGEHWSVGVFPTLEAAQAAAEQHASGALQATKIAPFPATDWPPLEAKAQREARKSRTAKTKKSRRRELELDVDDFEAAR